MPRANRHFLPGHVWHITHQRCRQFKSFKSFNRCAPFKSLEPQLHSKIQGQIIH